MKIGQWTASALLAGVILIGGFGIKAVQNMDAHADLSIPPRMVLDIGTVTPEAYGVAPWVTNTGTPGAPTLNFGIPAGAPGTVQQAASLTTIAAGTVSWTYPVAYAGGVVPIIECVAIATVSTTYTINCQLDGAPTNTQAKFRVTRADVTTVALLGLNILSIPANPGITTIHVTARAP